MGKKLVITEELRNKHSNIDFDDFKYHSRSNTKLYRGKCTQCSKDRGYIAARDRWDSLCRSCNGVKGGSNNMKGKTSWNKDKTASLEQRIKQSCSHRGIATEDFDEFLHVDKKRHKFNNSGLREQCFEAADYTCDIYGIRGTELNAHHIESWHNNEDKRFDLDNLVCLSKEAHEEFHKIHGNNSTREQYEEFKKKAHKSEL